ncbi:hypothetical protein HY380_02500 [Candidatus Saccharibacteria bacterium]|nr:hypothetical protein [Candidatus Saccharibacteria bacterium]
MSTAKTRINISLPDDVRRALDGLAKRDKMPTATKAERLLEIALEIEEDQAWEQIASQRDKQDGGFVPFADAFKI